MQILIDTNLRNFDAWSGGLQVRDELLEHPDALDYVEQYLEEPDIFGPDFIREVDVNDFLWFEALDLCAEEGFYNRETGKWYDEEGFEEED